METNVLRDTVFDGVAFSAFMAESTDNFSVNLTHRVQS